MTFRRMERADIPSGLSLCRSAGWNQLSRDWEIFLTLDPQGNIVCVDDDQNVVGTVTTIRYGDRFTWIGMVLVDPSHRRRGIGISLLEQAIRICDGDLSSSYDQIAMTNVQMLADPRVQLKKQGCIKLDATPDGRHVYTKLGFQDEYGLTRMSASSINTQPPISSPTATALSASDLKMVSALDKQVFGADRLVLLSWILEGASALAFKVGNNNLLRGYCFGRKGYRYAHIGPVVADSVEIATSLISAALTHCGNESVILDVPNRRKPLRDWLESLGFKELRPFIRMFRGINSSPGIPENQFAILGPEFG